MAFVLEGERWNPTHTTITWSIATFNFSGQPGGNFSSWISNSIVLNDIANAFSQWDAASGLSFVEVADAANVDIRLGYGPIDGVGNTIGITYYTSDVNHYFMSGITIRFDSGENYFTQGSEVYVNNTNNPITAVVLHEVGHALGLDHINSEPAVMNSVASTNITLRPSDIQGIQFLYGPGGPATAGTSTAGTSTADGNQVTGENFMGPGGGSGDLFIVANHSGIRTAQALQIENGNVLTSKVIVIVGSNVDFDGAGDCNHDGLADLLAHSDNFSTGMRSLFSYKMTPVGPAGTSTVANLGLDWITDAFGDFNGDGTSDILLHRDSGTTRALEVLSMNNYAVQSTPIVQVTGVDWVADGTGDFNHDGTSDILMHRDSANGVRTLEVLTIQNNAIQSATVIAQVGTNISVDGIGDFNSDGTSDIALHQDVGTTRTDLIFNVVNNTVVNPHTVAVTGIDWDVS
jgi:predicted Zn-dependent protease